MRRAFTVHSGLLVKPQPFRFAAPIDARPFGSSWGDTSAAKALRDAAQAAVQRGIRDLQAERAHDPARSLAPRLWGEAKRLTHAQAATLRRILRL